MRHITFNQLAIAVTLLTHSVFVAAQPIPTQEEDRNQAATAQSKSGGLIEDSSFNVLFRNFYINRDYRNSSRNGYGSYKKQSYDNEWSQGFIGTFQSGFTQGTVGFGFDVIGRYGFRLDSGRGRSGTGLLPLNSNGRAARDFGSAGGTAKIRVSNTVLRYGEQYVNTPVFATDDGRTLPETAEGFLLTMEEVKNLTVIAGHFTGIRAQNQSYRDSVNNGTDRLIHNGRGLKRATFGGFIYQFTPDLSASLYYSDVEDYWTKKYANLSYNLPIDDKQALSLNLNYYNTKNRGKLKRLAKNGELFRIDNNLWSIETAYTYDAHRFMVAYQSSTGHGTGAAYGVDGGASLVVANSVQYSDFNNEGERSWQVRYDLNMESYGVPGLTFMTRYVRGTNISKKLRDLNKTGGKVSEWEHDIEAKYLVQNGFAKNLSLRARYATYRSSGFSNDVNDFRIIVEYPWDVISSFKK